MKLKKQKHDSTKEQNNNSTLIKFILAISIIQIIVLISIILPSENNHPNYNLDNIDEKLTRLDGYFAANAQGYVNNQQVGHGNENNVQNPIIGDPLIEDRPFIGDINAPITIVEYSDFECPFCGRFYSNTLPELKEEFIDTGKAKLVFKDFPLSFHQMAEPSAIASKCVFKEAGNEAFFKYHDIIFENQQSINPSNLKNWAIEVGVNEEKYNSCIQDPKIKEMVDQDFAEGQSFGVSGTPSFVINEELLVGAQPIQAFRTAINSKLN